MDLVPRRHRSGGLTRFQNEMHDLFRRFFGDWDVAGLESRMWPTLDIADKEDAVVVNAEMPGCKAEDIELSVYDNTLIISGEKKESSETREEDYYRTETYRGKFRRDVSLPTEVDADNIKAECQDGVLNITLPKMENSKARRIKVQGK